MAEGGGHDEFLELQPFIRKVNKALGGGASTTELKDLLADQKDNSVAQECITKGDEMLQAKKYLRAIEFYSTAIANAVNHSSELGQAYIGRAETLMSAGYYKECLEDLERVKGIPITTPKAQKRFDNAKKKAQKKLGRQTMDYNYGTVPEIPPGDRNKRIKCASKAVAIRENPEYGRHLVATRDITIGELIAVENPYATILADTQERFYCFECMQPCLNLIPCLNCTRIMFCGMDCRRLANKKYHKYECAILKTIRTNFMKHTRLALHVILRNKKILSDANACNFSSSVYCSDRLWEVLRLRTNAEPRAVNDVCYLSKEAAWLYDLLVKHTTLFDEFPSERNRDIFKGLQSKLAHISLTNSDSTFNCIGEDQETIVVGVGNYPFLSLLNHSCAPNVFRIGVGPTMILRANTNIKEGEQLFDDYGYHHAACSRPTRQQYLRMIHFFTCKCPACEYDWPTADNLVCYDLEAYPKLIAIHKEILQCGKRDLRLVESKLTAALKLPKATWKRPSSELYLLDKIIEEAHLRLAHQKIIMK